MTSKEYNVFRKEFHIPTTWYDNILLKELIEFKYRTSDIDQAFEYIEQTLKKLGYSEDNNKMLHDYIHYMIKDLFIIKNVEFIEEDFIRTNKILFDYFKCTPDLIIKGRTIIDIYVGDKDIESIKSKYRKFSSIFDFKIITPTNMTKELKNFFNDEEISYLYQNYYIFKCEYQYWQSCLKLKKILKNNIKNIQLIKYNLNIDKFNEQNEIFHLKFKEYIEKISDYSDI